MRYIDEDNVTQAVIACHAEAGDERLRELMTSLVQHVHAFAREVRLTEAEWAEGIRFLIECGRLSAERRQELVLLSDTLGLSMLVAALNHRPPKGCTESAPHFEHGGNVGQGANGEPCYVAGRVRALDGTPIAGAEIRVWPAGSDGAGASVASGADGSFHVRSVVAGPHAVPHDGPVGQMLRALGRHPWRPAHLRFMITAPGYQRLVTHVYRRGDEYLDADAVFGVRRSLVADWVRHAPGPTPDGHTSAVPFTTLDFAFVLNANTGDKP